MLAMAAPELDPTAHRPARPSRAALQRLRQIWRSAGWPCQDLLEVELLAAGLVERVALEMQRGGRIVWRGLSLRAGLPGEAGKTRWVNAMPDVFSIRHSTVEDYLEPAIHEIKVSRADLLGELRRPAKSAAYRALCGQCWFVLKAGIAEAQEIPPDYGLLFATANGALELARPAPKRAHKPDFATWLALARATPVPPPDDDPQSQF